MGSHIDGYICVVAHSHIVPSDEPIDVRKADVINAAYYAMEGVLRLIKDGACSSEVINLIQNISKEFNCTPITGTEAI